MLCKPVARIRAMAERRFELSLNGPCEVAPSCEAAIRHHSVVPSCEADAQGGATYCLEAIEITVGAAEAPPMLASKDSSPGGTSGSRRQLQDDQARRHAGELKFGDDASNLDLYVGDGRGKWGLDGATSPVVTGGSTSLGREIGGDILSGARRSLRRIEGSIGQVDRQYVGAVSGSVKTPGPVTPPRSSRRDLALRRTGRLTWRSRLWFHRGPAR